MIPSKVQSKNGETPMLRIGISKSKGDENGNQDELMIKVHILVSKPQMDNTINYINEKLEEILRNIEIGNENLENGFKHIEYLCGISMNTFIGSINAQYENNLYFISEKFQEREELIKQSHKREQETHEIEKANLTKTINKNEKKIDEMTNEISRLKESKKYFRRNFTNSTNIGWNYSEDDVTLTDNRTCLVFLFAVSYYPSSKKIRCWIKYIGNSPFVEHIHGSCIYAIWHCSDNSDTQSIFYNGQELLSDGFYRLSPRVRTDSICTSWINDCEFVNE